jgi:Zn-finger nucleic acid-binding protein
MQCPIDGTQLVMSDRNGVEIDYCPQCRGVWLDRGELDKIIERSAPPPAPPQAAAPAQRDYDRGYDERPRKKKRDSFLSDIFDF